MDARKAIDQLAQSNNGIHRLSAMIGAKDFVRGEDFVQFKFNAFAGKDSPSYNFCKITLETSDTYTMELGKIKNHELVKSDELDGLWQDELKETFENTTGLCLSL